MESKTQENDLKVQEVLMRGIPPIETIGTPAAGYLGRCLHSFSYSATDFLYYTTSQLTSPGIFSVTFYLAVAR